jgi:predicted hotdog family 3-hydroxylacyl-ACP dehydratase
MSVDREAIERYVPQRGSMCLLDGVTAWDAQRIACRAAAPDAGHPLARDGLVPTVAAVEYAAQATAVHGALLEPDTGARTGLLATLAEVELHGDAIALDGGPLAVCAERISRSAAGCLYDFEVRDARRLLARGRLMIAFIAAEGV